MPEKWRLAIIGTGMMGGALARGFIAKGVVAHPVLVFDSNPEAARKLAADLGSAVQVMNSAAETDAADIVLLAVKPAQVLPLLPLLELKKGQIVLSIAAGLTLSKIESALAPGTPVIRAMPNTPALVGCGATALSGGTFTNDTHLDHVKKLFQAVGEVVVVEERLMDAVTGLSGSGPAFVYLIIEALTDGGVKQGLPRATARLLAAQTVHGAAEMVVQTGEHPAQLKDNVTTPGGTTIAGLASLERAGVRSALIEAVEAAAERSRELSGS
jgi:pyrroline-5-carboxylate reductase